MVVDAPCRGSQSWKMTSKGSKSWNMKSQIKNINQPCGGGRLRRAQGAARFCIYFNKCQTCCHIRASKAHLFGDHSQCREHTTRLAPGNIIWAFAVTPKLVGKPRNPKYQQNVLLVGRWFTNKCARFVGTLFFCWFSRARVPGPQTGPL